jgi:prepilin-type processing-associated H-X9-DG protein
MIRKGLTRIDAVVALSCVVLILAQVGILNAGGRERSKREVCLANLRMLTAAWQMYADNNAGKIVCGDAEEYGDWETSTGSYAIGQIHYQEKPWILNDWQSGLTLAQQKGKIMNGALFTYVKDIDVYKCPSDLANEARSFSMVDAMNCNVSASFGVGAILIKSSLQIVKPAERFVFLDHGGAGGYEMGGFTCYISQEKWWDLPPVSHDNGAACSFADGHSAFHKWKSQETIIIGGGGYYPMGPITCAAKNDLYWIQIGCWGQLGYTPSCPVNPE